MASDDTADGPARAPTLPLIEALEIRQLYAAHILAATPMQIMPLGDSITTGAYPWGHETGGYRLGLAEDLKAAGVAFSYAGSQIDTFSPGLESTEQTRYEGHPGWRADELNGDLLADDTTRPGSDGGHWLDGTRTRAAVYPNIVLLEAGTNDVLERESAATVAGHLEKLLRTLVAARPNAHILVGSLLPIDEPRFLPVVQEVNDLLRTRIIPALQKLGRSVTFVDQYRSFVSSSGKVDSALLYDHIHPVAAGYTLMANQWAAAIESIQSLKIHKK